MYTHTIVCSSAVKSNEMTFEGKRMELKKIIMSKIVQTQKYKDGIYLLIGQH